MSNSPLSNFNKQIEAIINDANNQYDDYRRAEEQSSWHETESTILAILTGYVGARAGKTQDEVLKLMMTELIKQDIPLPNDLSREKREIETGFFLYGQNPDLEDEHVRCVALDWHENLY